MSFLDNLKDLYGKKQDPQATSTIQAPSPKKILIVEDEKLLGDALEIKFKNAGYTVLRAFNGQEGLQSATINKPNIILLDILMPQMDGKTMLSQLRKIPEFKQLPVIVLSNAGSTGNMHDMFYDNVSDFLIKSNVSVDDILQRVTSLVH